MHVVAALVAAGRSVLLTSYQHSAVDNVAVKLVQAGVHGVMCIPGRQVGGRAGRGGAWAVVIGGQHHHHHRRAPTAPPPPPTWHAPHASNRAHHQTQRNHTRAQVHPALREHVYGGARFPAAATTAGLEAAMATARVVAVTCLGAKSALLARRTFDVCVLDEASQARAGGVTACACVRVCARVGRVMRHAPPPRTPLSTTHAKTY